ncbi:MAG: hypothetical protein NT169_01600 [Chloroflexi bacterium]|nr:hypothetical protein [Chloroflexota bacterium]
MNGIALRAGFPTAINPDEVRNVVGNALRHETDLARARLTSFERACRTFEKQYRISSDDFMRQFESGALGDEATYFDWYAAKRGLDVWERKLHILAGVSV